MQADSYKRIRGALRQVRWSDRSWEAGERVMEDKGVAIEAMTFAERVAADVRGQFDPELRKPENVSAWYDELIALRQSVEAQLVERKAQLDAYRLACDESEYEEKRRQYEQWRARTIRFLTHVNRRILEAKRLLARSGIRWGVQWWEGVNRYGFKTCGDVEEAFRFADTVRDGGQATTVQVVAIVGEWRQQENGEVSNAAV